MVDNDDESESGEEESEDEDDEAYGIRLVRRVANDLEDHGMDDNETNYQLSLVLIFYSIGEDIVNFFIIKVSLFSL